VSKSRVSLSIRAASSPSGTRDSEDGFGLALKEADFGRLIVTPPYGFIGRFQGINGAGLTPVVLSAQIFNILKKNAKTNTYV
jgi:hypothetical protein